MKRLILVTGFPGVGKTTVVVKTAETLRGLGYQVGGMLTREIREQGKRVGFEIIDFVSRKKGWLAHVDQPVGPQVSKYRVNLNDLDTIGANAIRKAVTNADIIVVDEIGIMELFSPAFKETVIQVVNSSKPLLGTIQYQVRDSFTDVIRRRDDAEIITVTYENRVHLHKLLINKIKHAFFQAHTTSHHTEKQ